MISRAQRTDAASDRDISDRRRGGQEGVALMVVLLFIVLLTVIVVEYAYEMQVEASLAANVTDDFRAYIAAKSAVASGMGLLEADLMENDIFNTVQSGGLGGNTKRTAQQVQQGQQAQNPEEDVDSLMDVWAQGVPYQALNDAIMQCSISDEYGKLNLNALVDGEGKVNEVLENALRTLFANLTVEKDPTDAILDWVDPDEDPRPDGAESDTYSGFETPYACKNGLMDSIDELLLIADIPPEFFFDALVYIRGGQMDDQQEPSGPVPLSDLLTVHGEPSGAVNVNTARPEVLDALLGAAGDNTGAAIGDILQMRLEEPFRSAQDFSSRTGVHAPQQQGTKPTTTSPGQAKPNTPVPVTRSAAKAKTGATQNPNDPKNPNRETTPQSQGPFTVRSDIFRIYGDGQMNNVMVRIEAYVFRLGNEARSQAGMMTSASPSKPNSSNSGKTKASTSDKTKGTADSAMETFRILDWRVIR